LAFSASLYSSTIEEGIGPVADISSNHISGMIFQDRREAGRKLAARLGGYSNRPDVVVLALPRGGVPVAFEVADALDAPLDIFLVRKLGVPGEEELAMGAIGTGGVRILNEEVVHYLNISNEVIDAVAAREQMELERREVLYRGYRPALDTRGRSIILVDDGLATGSTMRAATAALRKQQPARIVVAVPVAAPQTCEEMRMEVDEMVCLATPEPFHGVGLWYEDFSQTTNDEIRELLEKSASKYRAGASKCLASEEKMKTQDGRRYGP
jgi:putative phosphoribosyl transferase